MKLRDIMLGIAGGAFNRIVSLEGEEGVYKCWQENIAFTQAIVASHEGMKSGKIDARRMAEAIVILELCHGSEFSQVEDDEKIDTIYHNCNVCTRMAEQGRLDFQGGDIGTLKEPHEWTNGQVYQGMPHYCVHAPVWFREVAKQTGSEQSDFVWGSTVDDDGKFVWVPCRETYYKKPRNQR